MQLRVDAPAKLAVQEIRRTFYRNTANQRVALDGVSLLLQPGDFATVIGGNGAGKSTLLNAVAGEISVDDGTISVDGIDVTGLPTEKRARWISRVFQDPQIGTAGAMTIEENLGIAEQRGQLRKLLPGLNRAKRDAYRELLSRFGLGLEDRMSAKVGLLSGGQRQSLSLLMAVLRVPELLLLDEHTAALDPRTADIVMAATAKAVAEAKLTALMVTHNMQQALAFGNRLIMMHAGRIVLDVSGAKKAALTVSSLIEQFHLTSDSLLLES